MDWRRPQSRRQAEGSRSRPRTNGPMSSRRAYCPHIHSRPGETEQNRARLPVHIRAPTANTPSPSSRSHAPAISVAPAIAASAPAVADATPATTGVSIGPSRPKDAVFGPQKLCGSPPTANACPAAGSRSPSRTGPLRTVARREGTAHVQCREPQDGQSDTPTLTQHDFGPTRQNTHLTQIISIIMATETSRQFSPAAKTDGA